jgi:hypothetical protein
LNTTSSSQSLSRINRIIGLVENPRTVFHDVTLKRVHARYKQHYAGFPKCCLCGEIGTETEFPTQFECNHCFRDIRLLLKQMAKRDPLHPDSDAVQIISSVFDELNVSDRADLGEFLAPIYCFSCGRPMHVQFGRYTEDTEQGVLKCRSTRFAELTAKTTEWLLETLNEMPVISPVEYDGKHRNACPNCRAVMLTVKHNDREHLKCPRCALRIKAYYAWNFQALHKAHEREWKPAPIEDMWGAYQRQIVGDVMYGSNNAASGKVMHCIVAGFSGNHEPVWPAVGQFVIDGSVRWIVKSDPTFISRDDIFERCYMEEDER